MLLILFLFYLFAEVCQIVSSTRVHLPYTVYFHVSALIRMFFFGGGRRLS